METKDRCKACNSTDGLIVHHKDQDRSNDAPDTRITLCYNCHQETHYGTLGRNMEIRLMRNKGKTIQEVANKFQLTRQRVHQILHQK